MYWNTAMMSKIIDAPFPLTKYELMEYVERTSGDKAILMNLEELEDSSYEYESLSEIWPDIIYYLEVIEPFMCGDDDYYN